jgi:hypothetical protein
VPLDVELEAAIRAAAAGAAFDFDAWALRIFAHQVARNVPYRRYCERLGVGADDVHAWDRVPAVPVAAFRHADLTCGGDGLVFRTSGTSGGAEARGRHFVPHPDVYRTGALATFARFVLPDGARPHLLCLLPPPDLRPDSSLVHMCAWVAEAFGESAAWFAGADGLDVAALADVLADHARRGSTLLLLGPTAAFVRLFDTGLRVRLGPGSRLMDTGGAKGMARPLSRPGFLRACWEHLGVATYLCVNEYGMTELCSQRYDSVLADRFSGRSLAPRRLVGPPWLRTRVLDPDTLAEVPPGEPGLLCHHDLANLGSVSVVLTEDLGRTVGDDGIAVTGRVRGAPPRGCGQLLEAMEP